MTKNKIGLMALAAAVLLSGCADPVENRNGTSNHETPIIGENVQNDQNERYSSSEANNFLEAMAEAGKSVSDHLGNGERIVYVNVMNRLSIDCDCNGNPREPDIHDIGILASTDPVALDQACIDLIYEQKDGDGASFVNRVESLNGLHTLEHAEEIGLGSRSYTLVNIDE